MNDDWLFNFFYKEFPFGKEGLELFLNSFKVKYFKKGDSLLHKNQVVKELYFLDEGIVREYYAHEGKEKNIDFYFPSEFPTDFYSFIHSVPTKKNQECLTDIKVRILKRDSFDAFVKEYPCGKMFIEKMFHDIIKKKEEQEFKHFLNTLEENYLELMQSKFNWMQHIPQYHIASYLGVTPETLSRVRKRI